MGIKRGLLATGLAVGMLAIVNVAPVQAASTSKTVDGLTVQVDDDTKTETFNGVQDIYAIADLHTGVYNMDNKTIMNGSVIANGYAEQLVGSDYIGQDAKLLLSKGISDNKPTLTFINGKTDIVATIKPPTSGDIQLQKIVQNKDTENASNWYLWAAVTYAKDNFVLSFIDSNVNIEHAWDPDFYFENGELFGIPTERKITVNYIDKDTGRELAELPTTSLDTQTGYKYAIKAKPAPKNYKILGKLNDNVTVTPGQSIISADIDEGVSNIERKFDNFDENMLDVYRIKRNVSSQGLDLVLQGRENSSNFGGFKVTAKDNQGNITTNGRLQI